VKLACDSLEPLGRSREVGAPQVARARGRSRRRVRGADALLQQLELFGRLVQARGEAGRVQQAPEVVAWVGEVRLRRGGHPPGVDTAEHDPQVRAEDVRYGATSGRAGKAGTASYG